MDIEKNKAKFIEILSKVGRKGIPDLLKFLEESDFYEAPASTRFHNCIKGGLCDHSLNVYRCLKAKRENPLWKRAMENISDENIIITALCHDLAKVDFYEPIYRNKKVYNEEGKKKDEKGRFDWVSVESFEIKDTMPITHAAKSVLIAQNYIKLEPVEMYGILWHMGFTEPKEVWNTLGNAIQMCPFVLAVHEADTEATYLLEEQENV